MIANSRLVRAACAVLLAASISAHADRKVEFPSDRPCGKLFLKAAGAEWKASGDAWGEIDVPDGSLVRLVLGPDDTPDLSFLFTLEPNAIDDLRFEGYPLVNSQLASLKMLTGLRALTVRPPATSITGISDDGLKHLAGLVGLEYLALPSNTIYGQGLAHLAKLGKLATLDLSGTQVDDKAFDHLAALKSLKSLDLSGTAFSIDAEAKLAAAIPGLKVIRTTEVKKAVATGSAPVAKRPAAQPQKVSLKQSKMNRQPDMKSFEASFDLPPGTYQYKFYDATDAVWHVDPLNTAMTTEGEFTNSVVKVPGGASDAEGKRLDWPKVDDSVNRVTFRFLPDDPTHEYHVLGNFNGWKPEVPPADKGTRTFELTMKLQPGEYQYKFYSMRDNVWMLDPSNPAKGMHEGGENSVVKVPGGAVGPDGTRAEWPKVDDKTGEVTFHASLDVTGEEVHVLGTFNKFVSGPETMMKVKK